MVKSSRKSLSSSRSSRSSRSSSSSRSSGSSIKSLRKVEKYIENNRFVVLLVLLVVVVFLCSMKKKNRENFESGSLEHNPSTEFMIVFFKMEGCGHCKNFAPTWDKVSSKMNNKKVNGKTCKMVTVDSSNSELTSKYNVSGFPTIMKVSGNNAKEYEGDRSEEDVVKFINS